MGFKINGYIIGGVIMVAISAFCGVKLYEKWKPNDKVMSLYEYYDMTEAISVTRSPPVAPGLIGVVYQDCVR